VIDAMSICNSCGTAPADPGSVAGYCPGCMEQAGADGRDGSLEISQDEEDRLMAAATASEPEDACPQLIEEMNRFYDDPMTDAVGDTGDLSALLYRRHLERHKCQGYGG
jgi:hypothetical protein